MRRFPTVQLPHLVFTCFTPPIKKQQAKFQNQPRQSEREMVSGESHYVFGKRYRLEVIARRGRHEIVLKNCSTIQLFVNPSTSIANRKRVLTGWYPSSSKIVSPLCSTNGNLPLASLSPIGVG